MTEVREVRKAMDGDLTELFPSSVPRFRVELQSIRTVASGLESAVQSIRTRSDQELSLIGQLLPTMQSIQSSLETLRGSITTLSLATDSNSQSPPQLPISVSTPLQKSAPQPQPFNSSIDKSIFQGIQVNTMVYETKNCTLELCGCQCHRINRYRVQPLVAMIVGSLFVGYSGTPFTNRPECDQKKCSREKGGLIKLTYYFPSWMPLKRMVSFTDRWQCPEIHNFDLQVPRVVPATAEIFMLAQKGNIQGLQMLFDTGKASIFDASAGEGRSVLHYALTGNQPQVVSYLISKRANIHVEDKTTLSPLDCLWNYLLEGNNNPVVAALREPFAKFLDESEDLQRRSFSPIHRVIFGLAEIDLEACLKLSTSDIDRPCSLGRTPLCWAALRPDHTHVITLIKYGAALHLADWRGQSPFHLAAETGHYKSLEALLRTASRRTGNTCTIPYEEIQEGVTIEVTLEKVTPFCLSLLEARASKGRTPLHFATRVNFIAHASILLRYGADVNSTDSILRTPLLIATYWNHHDVLELLLAKGARTDVLDANRMTILHYAAKFGDSRTLEILQKARIRGVSIELRDSAGYTALETFEQLRSMYLIEDNVKLLKSRNLMEALLDGICETDSLYTEEDDFFDALSSLEASVASLDGNTDQINQISPQL